MSLFSILVDVAASSAQFQSEMRRVTDTLEEIGEVAKRAFEFAGAAAGLVSLSDSFMKAAESGEQLTQLAGRMGTTVASLSQLQYATRATNVPFQTLISSIDSYSRNVVQASDGTGKAKKAIADLGIDAAKLAALPLDTQLGVIADKIAALPTPTLQTAAAMRIFGQGGADLLPILDRGAAGIDQLRQRADDLGITLGTGTAEALARANSAITDLSASSHAFWTHLLADAAPAIETWEKGMLTIEKSTREALGDFSGPQEQIHALVTKAVEASNQLNNLQSTQGWFHKTFFGDITTSDINQAVHDLASLSKQIADLEAQMAPPPAAKKSPVVSDPFGPLGFSDIVVSATKVSEDAMQKYYDSLNVMSQTDLERTLDSWDAKENAAKQLYADGIIDAEEYSTRIQALNEQFLQPIQVTAKRIAKTATQNYSDMEKYANSAASSIQASFATFLGDPTKNTFKAMEESWLQTLDKMAAEAAASQIFKLLFGDTSSTGLFGTTSLGAGLGGLLSSIFGIGGGIDTSGIGAAADADFGSALSGAVGSFATGGSFDVGGSGGTDSQLTAFWATPGEHVQVGQGGGGAIQIVNNVNVTSPQVTKEDVLGAMAQTQTSTVNKLQDMKRRGKF